MARRQAGYTSSGEEIQEESSWRYPLTIFFVTLLLSGLFLYIYVGPGVDDLQGATPKPTISEERTTLIVGDTTFSVPASYTIYPRDRRPGEKEDLALYAAWPRLEGYTPARKVDFTENRPNSRRIDMVIERKKVPFSETDRLQTLYISQTLDKRGTPDAHGLTRFDFRQGTPTQPASGYADKVMYLGEAEDGAQAVLFCYRESEDRLVPPDCFRQFDLSATVAVKYYFKRPYLPEWRRIDARVRELIGEFAVSQAAS